MYDTIIIGGGFAGLSAAIYTTRYDLKTLVLAQEMGGAITDSAGIENYPGYKNISGYDLMKKFEDQARSFGAEINTGKVLKLEKKGKTFKVRMSDQEKEYESMSLILALGTERRKLKAPGAEKYEGKGVHYCATCDGAFYRDKTVAVMGGSNAAAHSTLLLSRLAKKVYVIYRRQKMRCEPILHDRIEQKKNVEIIYNTNIIRVEGDKFVSQVELDKEYQGKKKLMIDGLFVEIGSIPNSELAKQLKARINDMKEIVVDKHCSTNIPGVFAAGDVTNTVLRQGVTAAAQGVIAATSAYQLITNRPNIN